MNVILAVFTFSPQHIRRNFIFISEEIGLFDPSPFVCLPFTQLFNRQANGILADSDHRICLNAPISYIHTTNQRESQYIVTTDKDVEKRRERENYMSRKDPVVLLLNSLSNLSTAASTGTLSRQPFTTYKRRVSPSVL